MFNLGPILYLLGVILVIIGASMLVPAIVDIHHDHEDWQIFLTSSLITVFAGFFFILSTRMEKITLNLKQAILLTPLTWCSVSFFSALPFYLSELELDFAPAFFEAVSGLTTTGATVLTGLDNAPKGILLWRAILQYLGGFGIIAATLIILPALGVGGMQIFKSEAFGSDQKHLPRTSEVAKSLLAIYTSLCALCAFCYYQAGMGGFDSITHSFFTVSTGGFANYDASFTYFNNVWVEVIAIVFMILGALPFIMYFRLLHGNTSQLKRDGQIKYFLLYIIAMVLILASWLYFSEEFRIAVPAARPPGTIEGFGDALRYASFNLVSMITTCGFVTADYSVWGTFSQILFLMVMIVGGCMGSTAGGIKIFRFHILFQMIRSQLRHLVSPHGVFRAQYEKKSLGEEVLSSVGTYFFIFIVTIFIAGLCFAFTGLDFVTAFASGVALVSNAGPGLGPISGPVGNYSSFNDFALYIGSLCMLLGRLEILALLVLLSRSFWRE